MLSCFATRPSVCSLIAPQTEIVMNKEPTLRHYNQDCQWKPIKGLKIAIKCKWYIIPEKLEHVSCKNEWECI